eukprot:GFYU01001781.1.p1 GENE.GFYU01001781.1~~GFYU01001781.1.p1  ORF type:complete len:511 (-),score=141.50 GFYU01001781.1:21-1553(-)
MGASSVLPVTLVLFSLLCLSTAHMCRSKDNTVLVVGAGASGLGAARALQLKGCKPIILEGRDRTGGRIHVDKDLGLDVGGQWIHGTVGNPIRVLTAYYGVKTVFVNGDSTNIGGSAIDMRFADGSKVPDSVLNDREAVRTQVMQEVEIQRESLQRLGLPDKPLQDLINNSPTYNSLTEEEMVQLQWYFEIDYGGDMAASASQMSGIYGEWGIVSFAGGDSEFKEGFGSLWEKMAAGLDIRLGKKVIEVNYSYRNVEVKTADGDVFNANAVIVTVPLGVMKRNIITFDPPLPSRKVNAVNRLDMGVLNKIILRFPYCFWPKDQYTFGYVSNSTETVGLYPMIVNSMVVHDIPALVFMVGGIQGVKLESKPEHEVVAGAMHVLREMFGRDVAHLPEPSQVHITRWGSDEFAFGSYMYVPTGAVLPRDISAIEAPVLDTVFFAGEHTSARSFGYSYGAFMTGLRAVGRLTKDADMVSGEFMSASNPFGGPEEDSDDGVDYEEGAPIFNRTPIV